MRTGDERPQLILLRAYHRLALALRFPCGGYRRGARCCSILNASQVLETGDSQKQSDLTLASLGSTFAIVLPQPNTQNESQSRTKKKRAKKTSKKTTSASTTDKDKNEVAGSSVS